LKDETKFDQIKMSMIRWMCRFTLEKEWQRCSSENYWDWNQSACWLKALIKRCGHVEDKDDADGSRVVSIMIEIDYRTRPEGHLRKTWWVGVMMPWLIQKILKGHIH